MGNVRLQVQLDDGVKVTVEQDFDTDVQEIKSAADDRILVQYDQGVRDAVARVTTIAHKAVA